MIRVDVGNSQSNRIPFTFHLTCHGLNNMVPIDCVVSVPLYPSLFLILYRMPCAVQALVHHPSQPVANSPAGPGVETVSFSQGQASSSGDDTAESSGGISTSGDILGDRLKMVCRHK